MARPSGWLRGGPKRLVNSGAVSFFCSVSSDTGVGSPSGSMTAGCADRRPTHTRGSLPPEAVPDARRVRLSLGGDALRPRRRDPGRGAPYRRGRGDPRRVAVPSAQAPCPLCGQDAARVHSTYSRSLADLAWGGRPIGRARPTLPLHGRGLPTRLLRRAPGRPRGPLRAAHHAARAYADPRGHGTRRRGRRAVAPCAQRLGQPRDVAPPNPPRRPRPSPRRACSARTTGPAVAATATCIAPGYRLSRTSRESRREENNAAGEEVRACLEGSHTGEEGGRRPCRSGARRRQHGAPHRVARWRDSRTPCAPRRSSARCCWSPGAPGSCREPTGPSTRPPSGSPRRRPSTRPRRPAPSMPRGWCSPRRTRAPTAAARRPLSPRMGVRQLTGARRSTSPFPWIAAHRRSVHRTRGATHRGAGARAAAGSRAVAATAATTATSAGAREANRLRRASAAAATARSAAQTTGATATAAARTGAASRPRGAHRRLVPGARRRAHRLAQPDAGGRPPIVPVPAAPDHDAPLLCPPRPVRAVVAAAAGVARAGGGAHACGNGLGAEGVEARHDEQRVPSRRKERPAPVGARRVHRARRADAGGGGGRPGWHRDGRPGAPRQLGGGASNDRVREADAEKRRRDGERSAGMRAGQRGLRPGRLSPNEDCRGPVE